MSYEKTAIIVPAYNEEKALPKTLDELCGIFDKRRIIVVNDGSEDSTSHIANNAGVNVIDLPSNMGIGVAMQTGYRFVLEKGFKYAVQCDADGQHPPDQIKLLSDRMEETGADMVIGSRFVDKSSGGFKSLFLRRLAIGFFSDWISLITKGVRVHDVTSGFRLANERTLRIFADDYPFDYPEPESIILLTMHGCRIAETPVAMRERQGGVSSIGFFAGIYYIIKVTLGLLLTRLRKIN